MAKANRNVI